MKQTSSSKFVAALLAPLALCFAACSSPVQTKLNAAVTTNAERLFYAINMTTNRFYSINAAKLAEGEHCIVYADIKANVSSEAAEAIVEEYEAKIRTQITNAFGMFEDVDGNGKLILLLLDIIDGFNGGSQSSYVAGFFQAYHLFARSNSYPYSNEADMIFLDTNPLVVGSKSFYSTFAHEFQHLINFSQTTLKNGTYGTLEDTWIDEGLATAAEYIYDGHQTTRINFFKQDPYGSISYGNNFFVWDGYWESTKAGRSYDPVANYATVYLFFQWLRIHAQNDIGIYKEIIGSRYRDYRAVTEAAGNRIDASLGDWETLLRTWLLANAYNTTSGLLGYKGEIKTSFSYASGVSRSLAPGEAIFSRIAQSGTGSFEPSSSSGYIRYAGLTPSSEDEPDIVGPSYNGQYLLTFNANSQHQGDSETGYLAQGGAYSAGESMSMSRTLDQDTEPVLPGPFPIDVQFNPDGTLRGGQ